MGLQLSLSSLALGHRTALCVHRWLLPEGRAGRSTDTPAQPAVSATVPDSHGSSQPQNAAAPAPQLGGIHEACHPSVLSQSLVQRRGSDMDGIRPQTNGTHEVASGKPSNDQLHSNIGAGELHVELVSPGVPARSGNVMEPISNGRPRPSLEELEEGMPGAAIMDEETREDELLERESKGAEQWCDCGGTLLTIEFNISH